eukprot:14251175-Heterocapsa_arctica.AAC.1
MVMARMPGDRSTTFKTIQKTLKPFKAIYTSMCTPVGRTEYYTTLYYSSTAMTFQVESPF